MSIFYDFPNLSPEQRATNRTIAVLENSSRHQFLRQAEEKAFGEQQAREAENEKLSEQHRLQREVELRAEKETQRKENRERADAELRTRFFQANPDRTEYEFQSLLPKLREEMLLENINRLETSEDLMKQSGNYSRM